MASCPSESIDYAVMELSSEVAVVPMAPGWSDLGSWDALAAMVGTNSPIGPITAIDCESCYMHSDGVEVAAFGVRDLIIVASGKRLLIVPRGRSQEVKKLLSAMTSARLNHNPARHAFEQAWVKGVKDTSINVYQDSSSKWSIAALTHRKRFPKLNWLLFVTVIVPTALSVFYYGFFASDVYLSELRFVVRSPDKPSASGLGVLLKSAAFSNAGDEIYAADEYIQSRDALGALNRGHAVARAYSNANISIFNRFNPLGMDGSFEALFRYFQKKVRVDYDTASGITTLTVRAYTAQDAQGFNAQLLALAEDTVNRLNRRGRADVIELSEREVQDARDAERSSALALAQFRNASGIIDPEKQAAVQLQMISKLQDELIGSRMQLLQLRAMAPENPQIPILQVRVAGLAREIDQQLGRVAGSRRSLSATAARYQRLQLDREFAEKRLAAAMTSLQEARAEALRKQAYVERIAQPALPDQAQEPRRLRGIFATFALSLMAWAILNMLLAGVREHHA